MGFDINISGSQWVFFGIYALLAVIGLLTLSGLAMYLWILIPATIVAFIAYVLFIQVHDRATGRNR